MQWQSIEKENVKEKLNKIVNCNLRKQGVASETKLKMGKYILPRH